MPWQKLLKQKQFRLHKLEHGCHYRSSRQTGKQNYNNIQWEFSLLIETKEGGTSLLTKEITGYKIIEATLKVGGDKASPLPAHITLEECNGKMHPKQSDQADIKPFMAFGPIKSEHKPVIPPPQKLIATQAEQKPAEQSEGTKKQSGPPSWFDQEMWKFFSCGGSVIGYWVK